MARFRGRDITSFRPADVHLGAYFKYTKGVGEGGGAGGHEPPPHFKSGGGGTSGFVPPSHFWAEQMF